MCHSLGLLESQLGQIRIGARHPVGCPVGLAVSDEEEIHEPDRTPRLDLQDIRDSGKSQYHAHVAPRSLIDHLREHALRTDGPFTLRSGKISSWYLDARQTTFSGAGAWLVGAAVLEALDREVEAVGGMTMGADPIAVATAMVAASQGRTLEAFSIRKEAKDHGAGGRLVGPVTGNPKVAILEDTTTTGGAALEAADVAIAAGLEVVQAIALVDRSEGTAAERLAVRGIPFQALATPSDLGVEA